MNFLLRASQAAAPATTDHPTPPLPASSPAPIPIDSSNQSKQGATLEGLISDEKLSSLYANEDRASRGGSENGSAGTTYLKDHTPIPNRHLDVTEDEGWITIPNRELPDNWNDVKDISSFRSLDRSFVFPGEQVHILACLSPSKMDTEIVTPFKLAAAISKNGTGQNGKHQNGNATDEDKSSPVSKESELADTPKVVGESLIRMEDYRRQTEALLQRFKESHFFVRIAESNDHLWSKRGTACTSEETETTHGAENDQSTASLSSINAFIDKGRFDAKVSGGVARNSVNSFSLPNGDIVVVLQVNVGVDFVKDPTLEILQFEKYKSTTLSSVSESTSTYPDPCGELLKWLIPLDNSISSPPWPASPPLVNAAHKTSFSSSSGSQLFSFGNFRSYSMSSINSVQPNAPSSSSSQASSSSSSSTTTSKPSLELEDWDRFASQKFVKSQKTGSEGLLSFRGVPLEPERFSVRCGLEGIYIPGRRWRKHLEIVQPIDIHTFAADCNTDDLLCVQIKNVSPAHVPDIVVYIDAVTIIFEETSRGGSPSSIPIACIEAGTDYSLPNLALRRGEEHSFILKPANSILKSPKMPSSNRMFELPHSKSGKPQSNIMLSPKPVEDKKTSSIPDRYAVLVSCRCNYTESRLFFKKATNWKPRISRDLMISVASEISQQNLEHDGRVSQLPVQVLTLQASNLTLEDLTLTVLAPTSITSPPSVVTLNSNPSSPTTKSLSLDEQTVPISDVIPTTALGCNHLWLQSRVPLGCVPSQSTATVKLELLPLTDGIITLDTLQISVKEKGITYIPEHSLKINATSSIATGIV
ncbi:uncharacterized protein [Phyllobates terribilis]|uniref:uncharacterized protein n=1 Tax=Phyllobates terribilis TaxID=111132 RepID=UPI003CCAEAD5